MTKTRKNLLDIAKKILKTEYMVVSDDDCQTVGTYELAREEAIRQLELCEDWQKAEVKIYELIDIGTVTTHFTDDE